MGEGIRAEKYLRDSLSFLHSGYTQQVQLLRIANRLAEES